MNGSLHGHALVSECLLSGPADGNARRRALFSHPITPRHCRQNCRSRLFIGLRLL